MMRTATHVIGWGAVVTGALAGGVGLLMLSRYKVAPSTMHFEIESLVIWIFGALMTLLAVAVKGPRYRVLVWTLGTSSLCLSAWKLATYPTEAARNNPLPTVTLFPDQPSLELVAVASGVLLIVALVDRWVRGK